MNEPSRVRRFHTLDLIRGGAAIAVMLYHARRIVPRGYLAVDLFFVLSGFVLYHAYSKGLAEEGAFRRFAMRRSIRLAPLMLAGAVVGLAIRGGSSWTLLLVPNGHEVLFPANVPLWSLLFEMIASLTFAALFRFGRKAWAIVWAIGLCGTVAGIADHGSADLGFVWATALYGLARTAFSFCTGIAIAIGTRSMTQRQTWLAVPLTAIILAITLVPRGAVMVDMAAIFVLFPAGVALAAVWQVPAVRTSATLGGLSYALYAIHYPIVKLALRQNWPLISVFAGLLAAAWAAGRYYDAPLRSALASCFPSAKGNLPLAQASATSGIVQEG